MSTLTAILMAMTIVNGGMTVEKNNPCNNVQDGIYKWIKGNLTKYRYSSVKVRHMVADRLSRRIVAESERQGLDPLVMTTIAWIESNYRPYVRGTFGGTGRRRNEVGVWQLIPGDFSIRNANALIQGCPLSPRASKFQKWLWAKKYQGKVCKYPDIGKQRLHVGRFSRSELRDFYIGTWLAAYEMRSHINACKSRRPHGHRWHSPGWFRRWKRKNQGVNATRLERYLHYNWGPKQHPKHPYRRLLFVRYSRVRKEVCGKPSAVTPTMARRYNNRKGQKVAIINRR